MTQLLYAVSALAIIMLFNVGMQRSGMTREQEMYINEARTRMLGVAREVVDEVSRMGLNFDEATDPDNPDNAGDEYPWVDDPSELTPSSDFTNNCQNAVGGIFGCNDLDDLHNVILEDTVSGVPIELGFEVAYVDTLNGEIAASQTYAKQLTVTVSTTAIRLLGQPLSVHYSRTFAYPNPIDFARGVDSRVTK